MFRWKRNTQEMLRDTSGVSGMLTFLLVVFPLIVIIFAVLEIANLGSTITSMNRGLMDALVRTATSPKSMTDFEGRWRNNLGTYLVSQGNAKSQLDMPSASGNPYIRAELPQDTLVEAKNLYVAIAVTLDPNLRQETDIAPGITVSSPPTPSSPPMITIKIRYRYRFIGAFLSYLLAPVENVNSMVITSGMSTVNEHPNYVYSN